MARSASDSPYHTSHLESAQWSGTARDSEREPARPVSRLTAEDLNERGRLATAGAFVAEHPDYDTTEEMDIDLERPGRFSRTSHEGEG